MKFHIINKNIKKLKRFFTSRETITGMKRQPVE
jgi:hypothetical protein